MRLRRPVDGHAVTAVVRDRVAITGVGSADQAVVGVVDVDPRAAVLQRLGSRGVGADQVPADRGARRVTRMAIPCARFPEMTFRAPVAAPPIVVGPVDTSTAAMLDARACRSGSPRCRSRPCRSCCPRRRCRQRGRRRSRPRWRRRRGSIVIAQNCVPEMRLPSPGPVPPICCDRRPRPRSRRCSRSPPCRRRWCRNGCPG